jgi:antitoxin component YwqK of YwqJK toxin-antitoxin module
MKNTLLTLFLFSVLGALAQDTTRIYYPSGKLGALQVRQKPDTTIVWERSFFESGQLRGEITAIKEGEKRIIILKMIEYDDSGRLSTQINDTASIRYEPDGSVFEFAPRKNHRRNGTAKTYLAKRLFMTLDYKDDKKDGWLISYHDDGSISGKTRYKEDKQDGPTLSYTNNGKLQKTIDYVAGCPIKVTYYDANGKPGKPLLDKKTIYLQEGKPIGCK